MATISPYLRKRKNSKNLFPITIRITKDRKPSYIHLGQSIKECQWDKRNKCVLRGHPNALEINQLILKRLSELNKGLINSEIDGENIPSIEIKKKLTERNGNDYFLIAQSYLANIENRGEFHQLDIEKKRIEVFRNFVKKDTLRFNDIDVELIKRFGNFLMIKRRIKLRTLANYLITIRTIYNLAISKSIVDSKSYPFGKGKYQIRFPETQKIGLTLEEIKLLESIKGLTVAQQYALNAWLLSFYFAGIRITDILHLKWKDFQDNRLNYRMNKNNKILSLKASDKVKRLLEILSENSNSMYIFRGLENIDLKDKRKVRTRIKTVTRNFNRRLEIVAEKAGIDKKLTMHIARHSFGNISGEKIPVQILQKLYRHSSVTTTILYQANFIQQYTDEALESVVNF